MAGQTRTSGGSGAGSSTPSATLESLSKLRQAEQQLLSALSHAGNACRSLSTCDVVQAAPFTQHAESFLKDLYSAQNLIRNQIMRTQPDLPFENLTLLRLVEADLAVQRTAHIHRILTRTLQLLGEPIDVPSAVPPNTAASPAYAPSPFAPTPMVSLTTPTPITVAVPSPPQQGQAHGQMQEEDLAHQQQQGTPQGGVHSGKQKGKNGTVGDGIQQRGRPGMAVKPSPGKNMVTGQQRKQTVGAAQAKAMQTARAAQVAQAQKNLPQNQGRKDGDSVPMDTDVNQSLLDL